MAVPEHTIYYLEIVTPEVEAACRLYATAYGWRFQAMGPELGNAFVAELPGGSRCGIRAPMHDQERPIVRTYLRVTDIEKAVETAAQLGGNVALEPVEIPGHGTIAICLYGGIEQGLWQVP
jgi:predicted enzyme related to lactoylglutathione lyase